MGNITVFDGQSLLDVAIQLCGNIEAAYDFALLNNRSITDNYNTGESLRMPEILNKKLVDYYKLNNISPATTVKVEKSSILDRHAYFYRRFFDITFDVTFEIILINLNNGTTVSTGN